MSAVRTEDGFTLVELLVVILIGSIVMLALFGLVDMALPASRRINDRVETDSIGRNVMDRVVRELRTASCARTGKTAAGAAIYQAPIGDAAELSTGTKVTFYATIVGINGDAAAYAPERRQFELVGNQLIERRWTASGTDGSFTWPAANHLTDQVVADNVFQAGAVPVFTYYAEDASGNLTQVVTPTAADLPHIVQVDVRFKVLPKTGATPGTDTSTTFSDEATVRVPVDPAHPDLGPACAL
jgi:prepilin-type N-terminal cleavage/methylation domain-containing protein